jgi:sugar lactone lactonase YvrE
VGNFGFDPLHEEPRPTTLIRVSPTGVTSVAAENIDFPNGMVLLNDERVLVVAESIGKRLTAFDVGAGGELSNQREIAGTGECLPDGICADLDGNLLVTTMTCNKLVKYSPSGEYLESWAVGVNVWAVACSDAGDILLCTSEHSHPKDCRQERSGKIQRLAV